MAELELDPKGQTLIGVEEFEDESERQPVTSHRWLLKHRGFRIVWPYRQRLRDDEESSRSTRWGSALACLISLNCALYPDFDIECRSSHCLQSGSSPAQP